MKKRILVVAMSGLVATLIGCSSTKTDVSSGAGVQPSASALTPIADQRLAINDFKKNGVKIIYSLTGNLEAIEVTGYAPAWGGSHNSAREAFRVAELEAKKSLNDFINKETIATTTSVVMISENLEHARDNNSNKFSTNKPGATDELIAVDEDPDVKAKAAEGGKSIENEIIRNNAFKIASNLKTTITNTNRGILSGLYLKEGSMIDDGRAVQVVMRWDKKHNAARLEINKLMSM